MSRTCPILIVLSAIAFTLPAHAALVTYFPFDGNTSDVVGGHDATPGSNTTFATGVLGDALQINSDPDAAIGVISPTGPWAGNAVANDSIAFSFWAYRRNELGLFHDAFRADSQTGLSNVRAVFHPDQITWEIRRLSPLNSFNRLAIKQSASVQLWDHFVFQTSPGSMEVWMNGALIGQQSRPDALIPFTNLHIGSVYNGSIDDFAVWDEALPGSEIARLASGQSPLSIIPEPSAFLLFATGLGLWLFFYATRAFNNIEVCGSKAMLETKGWDSRRCS